MVTKMKARSEWNNVVNCIIPKKVNFWIPRTYEHVAFHGKRNSLNMIKLKILRWGDYPRSSQWVQCIQKIWGRQRGYDYRIEEGRDWSDVVTSQWRPAASRSWKRQRMDSLLEPPEGTHPCQHPDFSLWAWFQTSDL